MKSLRFSIIYLRIFACWSFIVLSTPDVFAQSPLPAATMNAAGEDVRTWQIASTPGSYPFSPRSYAAAELQKEVTTDKEGHQKVAYKDKAGLIVLKKVQAANAPGSAHSGWLCTYYVYDEQKNLRFVITPKAVETLTNNNWNLADTTLREELCSRYEYDAHNRMIVKQEPGAKEIRMVYDALDRLVLTQDGNLRAQNKWLATLYDSLGRPVMTGFYNTAQTQKQLQTIPGKSLRPQTITHTIPALDVLTTAVDDGRPQYRARKEINLLEGFELETEAILGANAIESTEIIQADNMIPALKPADLDPLTYTYYDHYNYPGKKNPAAAKYSKLQINIAKQAKGLVTGTKVRILGTSQWITTTTYYDAKGRVQQTVGDNANGGQHIVTNQYNTNDKLLSTYSFHSNPHSRSTPVTKILTTNSYDPAGRLLKITRQLNDDVKLQRDVAVNTYDTLGLLKETTMKKAGGVTMESLEYAYDNHGALTSINKYYVDEENASGHYFGEELGDHTIKWKGFIDPVSQAYRYSYDAAGRLTNADFTRQSRGKWIKDPVVNFDVKIDAYDANGNIMRLQQWGIKGATGQEIDDMTYDYNTGSNKLKAITDRSNDPATTLGDFSEAVTGGTDDYRYDLNGNLVQDNNKQIRSIIYNYRNQPQQINITGKGAVQYVYDANGTQLQKIITDSTGNKVKVTTTDYISGLVYEQDSLLLVNHDESRIRAIYKTGKPVSYVYDYFIKDHAHSTRLILTEETAQHLYMASMEKESAAKENALFSNIDASRSTRPSGYPKDQRIAPKNDYVARLNGNDPDRKIGPSIVLKVMAGDTVAISARAFYKSMGPTPRKQQLLPAADMAAALVRTFGGVVHPGANKISNGMINNIPFSQHFYDNDYQRLKDRDPGKDLTTLRPRAYLNYILFNEQFKVVDDNSGVRQVQAQPDQVQILAQGRMVMKKSGFLYVYTSNESAQDVFFDEMMVVTNQGAVLEEKHYYPFGQLIMSGISASREYKVGGLTEF